jgi:IclR family pca regulon transcriptional regulator
VLSVVKAFRILELLEPTRPALGMGEIARRAGMNRATAYRFCSTLVELGYLERDAEGAYRLGMKAVVLANAAAASREISEIATPPLQRLQAETGETVNLAVRDGGDIVYLVRLRSQQILGIQLSVGSRIPLYASSLGKAIAAFLPAEELEELLDSLQFERHTTSTITEVSRFRKDLGAVRKLGYALNLEELVPGLRGIAVPLLDRSDYPVAAINIAVTRPLSAEQLVADLHAPLRKAASEISSLLGHVTRGEHGGQPFGRPPGRDRRSQSRLHDASSSTTR